MGNGVPLLSDDASSHALAPPSSPTTLLTHSYRPPAPSYNAPPPYAGYGNKFNNIPVELVDDVRSVLAELKKVGILPEHQARVCLVLDISYSMQNPNQFFFDSDNNTAGPIDILLKQALATAMVFDDNQELEIFPFGTSAKPQPYKATKENFATVIANEIIGEDPATSMQPRTNYAAAMRAVRKYYFGDDGTRNKKEQDDVPVFMIFVTDGNHNMEEVAAAKQFRASSYQPIFCKLIALKGKEKSQFPFLEGIDDAPTLDNPYHKDPSKGTAKIMPDDCAYIDNADFVLLNSPSELTSTLLLREYPQWLLQAQENRHGHLLLTTDQKIDKAIVRAGMEEAERVGESRRKSCCNLL